MKKVGPWIGLGCLGVFFIFVGRVGIDFGLHWDEDKFIQSTRRCLENKTVLPGSYLYPSFLHNLTLAGLGPWNVVRAVSGQSDGNLSRQLIERVTHHDYMLRLRGWTIGAGAMSLIFVFASSYLLTKNGWEALLSAGFMGTAWEWSYHVRWWTVDPWLVMFVSATIFFLVLAQRADKPLAYLLWAGVAAGLAAGTKQTGLFLLPVVLGMGIKKGHPHPISRICRFGGATLVFFAVFFLITPGALLQTKIFVHDTVFQIHTYGWEGNDAYSIGRGLEHLFRMIEYFSMAAFSRVPIVAFLIMALAMAGTIQFWKRDPWFACHFLAFPFCLVFFFSCQVVMIVRNLLPLFPFAALLAARGFFSLIEGGWGRKPLFRTCASILVVFGLLSNAVWISYAAWTIPSRNTNHSLLLLDAYLRQETHRHFLLTPLAARELRSFGTPTLGHVSQNPHGLFDSLVFSSSEAGKRFDGMWPANRPGYAEAWFGPYEVNIEYYPTWLGDHRWVVMKADRAIKTLGPPSKEWMRHQ